MPSAVFRAAAFVIVTFASIGQAQQAQLDAEGNKAASGAPVAAEPGMEQMNQQVQPVIAMNTDPILSKTLLAAYGALGEDYRPRTEHLFEDGSPRFINRLILQDSPYLRQHAHNPVNWYPWGSEAFEAAERAGKPVFLSIGYATCHWCHVMERESFENLDIARLMNERFIAIKVDREQLPDVDALFMSAVIMISGSGGWPMSSFLDSDGRPFYGATYFPPERFTEVLSRIATLWREERELVLSQASQITQAISQNSDTSERATDVSVREIEHALVDAQRTFDAEHGGFGDAPKFPRESTLFFLLDQALRHQAGTAASRASMPVPDRSKPAAPSALHMADQTLERMAAGGIHDQVGGGFHRYAVDSLWQVPHFEKMLYNQAALARNYAQAFQLTGKEAHRRTASAILDYVLRDMRSPDGLFYSATDADSDGEEGRFYIWTPEELNEVLGDEDARLASRVWNVTGEGNFEGTSILHQQHTLDELAQKLAIDETDLVARMDQWREKLRTARENRVHPLRDEKIIASWNGMMISALAEGAGYLQQPAYLDAALRAANAILVVLVKDDGSLYRTAFDGRPSIDGTQADYAYLAEAFVALFDTTGERLWLERAVQLTDAMNERFWDAEHGAYYMGADTVGGAALSTRPKNLYDNSIPSGNSVALRVMTQLFTRTGTPRYETLSNELIAALSARVAQQAAGFHYLLTGISEHLSGEPGNLQYGGRGAVRAMATRQDDKLVVSIDLAEGWHINSATPLQDYLIPTKLSVSGGDTLANLAFPEAQTRTLGFQRSALSLYEGAVELSADWPDATGAVQFNLQLQACNEEVCLAPERLTLTLLQ